MQIRGLETADLDAAIAVLELAGLAGAKRNLERYLAWQPGCGWAAIEEHRLVGLVTVLRQGTAGFVGAMAVHPAHQGIGVGRRLLDHAHDVNRRAGVTSFVLEATPAGEPLYRRLGYVAEHETMIVTRATDSQLPAPPRIPTAELAAIARLDRAATGVVRDDMLAALLAEPGLAIRRDRALVGTGLIVGERLGPVIALDASTGRTLFDRLAPACRVAAIPEPNHAALDHIAALGFRELRRLRRMRLGLPVAMRPHQVWALASPGAG